MPERPVALDAFALMALLGDEPAAPEVRAILRRGGSVMATANLIEVVDRLERVRKVPPERVRPVLEGVLGNAVRLIDLTPARAWRAAELRRAHYHRSRSPISLADSVLLATADPEYEVATADPHVITVARAEGIGVIVLPDSSGNRAG